MKRPLAAACFTFALIRTAAAFLPQTAFGPLAAVFVLVLLVGLMRRKRGYYVLIPVVCLAGLAVQWVGLLRLAPVLDLAKSSPVLTVRVEKTVPGYREDAVQADLTVLELDGKALGPGRRFGIRCAAFPPAQPGEILKGTFHLKIPQKGRHRRSLFAHGLYLEADAGPLEKLGRSHVLKSWFWKLNRQMAQSVRRHLPREEGSILAAMTLGDKTGVTPRIQEAYRKAGVSHLLVVSGLHLSLLCAAFLGGGAAGRKRPKLRASLAIGMVLFLVMLTGQSASIRRAGTAAVLSYGGVLLLRAADPFTSLAVAAFLASLAGPYALCDLGLELSFAATLGIILGARWVKPLKDKAKQDESTVRCLLARAAEGAACPFMAALFTLPVQLAYGLGVSGVSVMTNLLVTMLAGPILALGFLVEITGLIPALDFASKTFALAAGMLVRLMNHIVFHCAELPFARLRLPAAFSVSLWVILAGSILLMKKARCRKSWWPCLALAVIPGILLHLILASGTVRLHSAGDSKDPSLVVCQSGRSLVVLRGDEYGQRMLKYHLEQLGIEKPDLLIDLRQKPLPTEIKGKWQMTVADFEPNSTRSWKICDIMTTSCRMKTGQMVLLDIKGYKVAVTEGECRLAQPIQVDLLLAGSQMPKGIKAEITAVAGGDEAEITSGRIYMAQDGFHAVIRPENAALLYGGSYASQ